MSEIEWTGKTWNPVLGCSRISAGCEKCYAMQQASRNWAMAQALPEDRRGRLGYYEGLTKKFQGQSEWTGKVVFVPEALSVPLKRRKPTTYFVNSMSDLFHQSVTDEQIDLIFAVMELSPQHTFQILTKRPERMRDYMLKLLDRPPTPFKLGSYAERMFAAAKEHLWHIVGEDIGGMINLQQRFLGDDVLKNVWLGVSVENQEAIDRIPFLLQTPAFIRFLSCEPLLERIDLSVAFSGDVKVDWVIAGAESGTGARAMDEDWVRVIRDRCVAGGAAFFYKQRAVNGRKVSLPELDGQRWQEMPKS